VLTRTSRATPLDDTTVARAAAGEETAFVTLYRDLHPRSLRYAASLVGAEAEDVAAETWLQIARDIRGFDGGLDAFRGWVATITRHRCLDHLRARARRPALVADLLAMEHRPAQDDTEQEAISRLLTARAVALISALPPVQAEAVMLRAVLGLDVPTAARILGRRPNAVRVAAHRGLRRLAAHLGAQPDEGGA
jgi:RNA polymerase sigma-70 factor (ECF subfamily)